MARDVVSAKLDIIFKKIFTENDLSEDTKIREMARLREKALHDEASALANAENKGIEKGRAEGKAEAEADIIKKMKAYGMSEEQIKAILSKG